MKLHFAIKKKNSDKLCNTSLQDSEKSPKTTSPIIVAFEEKPKQEESKKIIEEIELKSSENPIEQQVEINSVPNTDLASKQELDDKSSARNTYFSDINEINDDKLKNTFSTTYERRLSQYDEVPKLSNSLVMIRQNELARRRSIDFKPQKSCSKCLIF